MKVWIAERLFWVHYCWAPTRYRVPMRLMYWAWDRIYPDD